MPDESSKHSQVLSYARGKRLVRNPPGKLLEVSIATIGLAYVAAVGLVLWRPALLSIFGIENELWIVVRPWSVPGALLLLAVGFLRDHLWAVVISMIVLRVSLFMAGMLALTTFISVTVTHDVNSAAAVTCCLATWFTMIILGLVMIDRQWKWMRNERATSGGIVMGAADADVDDSEDGV